GIDARDDVPRVTQLVEQLTIAGQSIDQVQGGDVADWLVGVNSSENHGVPVSGPDHDFLDRLTETRCADPTYPGHVRMPSMGPLDGSHQVVDTRKGRGVGDGPHSLLDQRVERYRCHSRVLLAG